MVVHHVGVARLSPTLDAKCNLAPNRGTQSAIFQGCLKYLTDGEYRRMWKRIGFEFKFVEDVYMRTSRSRRTLQLAKVAAIFPPLHWLIRQTWERVPLLRKPA